MPWSMSTFSINMANSEAFWGVKKLSANLSFSKCVVKATLLYLLYVKKLGISLDEPDQIKQEHTTVTHTFV